MKAKEQRLFDEGMEHALKVAKALGVEELEKECRYRNQHPLMPNVNPRALHEAARSMMQPELDMLAVATATTLIDDLKLAPSMTKAFLEGQNERMSTYRVEPEKYEADTLRLSTNYGIAIASKKYMEE